jgi:hypothetical protein
MSPFTLVTPSVSYAARSWDLVNVAGAITVTLPADPALFDQVALIRNGLTGGACTIAGSPGQTINSFSSVSWKSGAATNYAYAVLQYMGSKAWIVVNSFPVDMSFGFSFNATVAFSQVLDINAGTDTASAAAVTTPTLGAAAQVNTVYDTMLYIVIGTAGTAFTIAVGPTSGVANTIVNSVVATSGGMYSVRLPAGWYIAVTGTTATWTATAIVC